MAVRKEIKEKEDFIFDGRILVNDSIPEEEYDKENINKSYTSFNNTDGNTDADGYIGGYIDGYNIGNTGGYTSNNTTTTNNTSTNTIPTKTTTNTITTNTNTTNTIPTNTIDDLYVDTLIIPAVPSVKNSLELSITKRDDRPRKNTQYYSQHLKKAAMSLFGGKLLYNPIKRLSKQNEKPEKKSKKQIQFIKENEKKLETEKRKKELIFLKSFHAKYLNLDTESKKIYLENFMEGGFSDSVVKKIILLKIEFYFDLWSLEKRKEEINEKVLIPCYLNCLNFIDRFISDPEKFKNISNLEMEFVFQKLIDCGFESTALELLHKYNLIDSSFESSTIELLHKYNLSLNLTFTSQKISKKPNDLDIYFQLKFAGDKLKRTLDSVKDKRVLFEPDKWQVDLLNLVDENRSAVVSAPTSSGKTFICFYAIEKVLRESDEGIVIFCLPTKALVNQVAADVYARFVTKVYSKKNMVLQGILMKDYQIDPYNCQVLITVPSMLESLLKSPPQNYIKNLKYIIIDEIHKISSEEMGIHIERIIHLSPCPLLVLSATIGNLNNFYNWIKNIENLKNRKCNLVIHKERYCDLKMYIFNNSLIPINPLFAYSVSYIKLHGKINTDLNFLPEDLLNIYYSVYAVLKKEQKYLIKELKPSKFFKSNILSKKDVKEFESFLLEKIFYWIRNNILEYQQVNEMYSYIIGDIERGFGIGGGGNEGYK
ncbi:hypothetical protein LUQ84_002233 [Hamiltosporidium tvaerminnensis]|nr:hypothetical protein LUQ84_002233 [Hamiltosporidium tvaerminnensis]